MKIKETQNKGLTREYEITFAAAELDEKISTRLAEVATDAKIPGFRPGKVPLSVVKARVGEQIKGEVIQTSLDDAVKEMVEDMRLASRPNLDIVNFEDGKALVAKLGVEVLPEIVFPDFASLTVERAVLPEDKVAVDTTMQRLADENKPLTKIEEKRKARLGDVIRLDAVGRIDGEVFEEGSIQDHMLELGSNKYFPGFEDGLVGSQVGQTVEVAVTFPNSQNYPAHLVGKEAMFECQIKELHEKSKAEARVDDELATRLGLDDLNALRHAVASQLANQHAPALRDAVKKNLYDKLAELIDFDVPPSMLQSEYDGVARSMAGLEQQAKDSEVEEALDKKQKQEAKAIAMRRARLALLLNEVANHNNIQVSEDAARSAILAQVKRFPQQERQITEYYQKNPDAVQQLVAPMLENMVTDYILELATVVDVETTPEVLYAAIEETSVSKSGKAAKKTTSTKKAAGPKSPPAKKSATKAVAKTKTAAQKKTS